MEQTDTGATMPEHLERPKFLTVLCILSFIATGLGIIMGIYNLSTVDKAQAKADLTYEKLSSSGNAALESLGKSSVEMAKHAFEMATTTIATNLLCLLGVFMMWNLKKSGYYLYTLGQLAAIIIPICFIESIGFFGAIMIGMNVFPIAFIIMYGVNLKHMS